MPALLPIRSTLRSINAAHVNGAINQSGCRGLVGDSGMKESFWTLFLFLSNERPGQLLQCSFSSVQTTRFSGNVPNRACSRISNQRLASDLLGNVLPPNSLGRPLVPFPRSYLYEKQFLFSIQALMNYTLKFQRSKWRHLLSTSQV